MVAVHDPETNKGNYIYYRVNANDKSEARMLVDRASSIARATQLDILDKSEVENLEKVIPFVSVQWDGIELRPFVLMLQNTWKRIWCHLIIADHDVAKASMETMIFSSTVLVTKIQYSSLLNQTFLKETVFEFRL